MTNFEMLRDRLLRPVQEWESARKPPVKRAPVVPLNVLEIEWEKVQPPLELMRNRLGMGSMRYGLIFQPGKKNWDRTKGIEKRMKQYQETGNTECLIDIANLAILEFLEGQHPKKHFGALDEDHSCQ